MKDKINKPKHYNYGTPEVIDIIDSWGLAGDFYAANVLKYFLRAPYKGSEEVDYRKAMWYLDKIYERKGECEIRSFNNKTHKTLDLKIQQLNLHWFRPIHCFRGNKDCEISIKDVLTGWKLLGKRRFFIQCFHYSSFHCGACIKTLSDLIDDVSDGTYEE